ncbi:Transthyretin-like family protein, partial [Oesophagostomum dentatum]
MLTILLFICRLTTYFSIYCFGQNFRSFQGKRDLTGIRAIDALDPDDKAGLTVVDSEDGMFKVEGCASDIDWLGPIHINRPEFYFKVRHLCNSDVLEEVTVFPPAMKVFAPKTMDYFLDNPI